MLPPAISSVTMQGGSPSICTPRKVTRSGWRSCDNSSISCTKSWYWVLFSAKSEISILTATRSPRHSASYTFPVAPSPSFDRTSSSCEGMSQCSATALVRMTSLEAHLEMGKVALLECFACFFGLWESDFALSSMVPSPFDAASPSDADSPRRHLGSRSDQSLTCLYAAHAGPPCLSFGTLMSPISRASIGPASRGGDTTSSTRNRASAQCTTPIAASHPLRH
mmetsp:Transcript_26034/g.63168  ORF Transcript_26034/g.63168 Transcript_26034/m.63168 type:complete len:223 (-) Transcript_26034:6-674(-)